LSGGEEGAVGRYLPRMQSPITSTGEVGEANDPGENCPGCGGDLRGGEIPPGDRDHFGGKAHFSRKIGIYDRGADRTVAWRCPDCGHEWARGAM
jgi:ribosomal protein L37AE/L43A